MAQAAARAVAQAAAQAAERTAVVRAVAVESALGRATEREQRELHPRRIRRNRPLPTQQQKGSRAPETAAASGSIVCR